MSGNGKDIRIMQFALTATKNCLCRHVLLSKCIWPQNPTDFWLQDIDLSFMVTVKAAKTAVYTRMKGKMEKNLKNFFKNLKKVLANRKSI